MFISLDKGLTWTESNPGGVEYTGIAIDKTMDFLYVAGRYLPSGEECEEEIELEEGQELEEEEIDRIETLYLDPQNQSVIFVGTNNLVAKTEDAGETWKVVSESFHRSDVNGIAIHPENSEIVYVRVGRYTFSDCSDVDNDDPDYEESVSKYCPGIYKSTDGGESW